MLGQSGPGSNGNEGVLCIPKGPALLKPHHQIVMSYPGLSLEWGSYPSAEVQLGYSTVPANRATQLNDQTVLFQTTQCSIDQY